MIQGNELGVPKEGLWTVELLPEKSFNFFYF